MHKVKNLTNSPYDLEDVDSFVRLPAMGEVTGQFSDVQIEAMKGYGLFQISQEDDGDVDIAAALDLLDPANDDHWTNAGLPAVDAVSDITGANVTRAQIKAARPDFERPAQA